jgi:hypothetical protein
LDSDPTVIIDDASHSLPETVLTFAALWPVVKMGGMYVIEDVQNVEEWKAAFSGCKFDIIDNRHVKNRYDDVLFVFKKG